MTEDNVIRQNGHPPGKINAEREVMAQDKPERQLTLSEVMRLGFVLPKQTEKPYTSFPLLISTTVIRREGVTKFQ
jgi:hypothetical protein